MRITTENTFETAIEHKTEVTPLVTQKRTLQN